MIKKRDLLFLFFVEILLVICTCFLQKTPGYMDAEYYTATGKLISQGRWTQEPFIWNYLDNPTQLPHTSFSYWMPLPGIIAALGFLVSNSTNFLASRIFFIVLSGFLPVLTYLISFRVTKQRSDALLAGFLGIFSGFYIVFFSIPESLLVYLLCGAGIYLFLDSITQSVLSAKTLIFLSFFIGLLVGLMHLSRADGLIWMVGVTFFLLAFLIIKKTSWQLILGSITVFLIGYFAIMGVWYFRNYSVYGSLFPPGNGKTLWITSYNQTFSFPSSQISITNWWNLGFEGHFKIYFDAFITNLKNLFAVQGLIYLLPFIIIGIVKSFKKPIIIFYMSLYFLNFIMMTFAFPFAGMRGGFVHSSAAFQPLFWAMTPVGLITVFEWAARKLNWNVKRSKKLFYPAIIILAAIFTCLIYATRVYGNNLSQNTWDLSEKQFAEVEKKLGELGAPKNSIIISKDPPGYYWVTGRESIALPDGEESTLVELSKQFEAKYVVIDKNHPQGLNSVFDNAMSTAHLKLLAILPENIQLYEIQE